MHSLRGATNNKGNIRGKSEWSYQSIAIRIDRLKTFLFLQICQGIFVRVNAIKDLSGYGLALEVMHRTPRKLGHTPDPFIELGHISAPLLRAGILGRVSNPIITSHIRP